MSMKPSSSENDAEILREKAEFQLARIPVPDEPVRSVDEMLYELQIRQIELEIQNEELRSTQLELEDSRDHYADLYEFAPIAYITLSSDGLISEINLAGAVLLGEARCQLLNRLFASHVATAQRDAWHAYFLHALETAKTQALDFTLMRNDGSIIHVCLDSQCRKVGGKITLRITLSDLNERWQKEEQHRLEAFMLDQAHDGIYLIDASQRLIYVNSEACRALGYSRDELLTLKLSDIDAHYSPEELVAFFDRGMAYEIVRHETLHRRRDGSTFPVEIQSSLFEYQGEMKSVSFARDITERKVAGEALRVSEERMRLFFERQLVGMAINSPAKGWLQVNESVCKMLGYSFDELKKLSWAELTNPDDLATDVALFEQMLAGKIDHYSVEKRYISKDGGIVIAALSVGCARRADGSVDYSLVLIEDVTERRRHDEELVAAKKILESQNIQLHVYREKLEQRVDERTNELNTSNQLLREEISEHKQAKSDLEETEVQLRGLLARRETVREDERKRIALEIHDELGQILTGLKLHVSSLSLMCATKASPFCIHMQEIAELTDEALKVARNVAAALRPVELYAGIVAALELQARRFSVVTGIQCKNTFDKDEILLNENCVAALYRIVQESLTNIARHAQASKVDISLVKEDRDYVLKVRDNGIGFDVSAKKEHSFGLQGIRERTRMLGGVVSIKSGKGCGTEIIVRILEGDHRD